MGMQEGTIVSWLKAEGDHVEKGEALCDVEAAKVTATVDAPASGRLSRIVVPVGDTVEVLALLAEIETSDEPGP
jgi:pyruvate/2-oxoglutarate dehydrogenase complex dihydrolipoamide acyltransferase (E2) component